MAEEFNQERTEAPTQRRREEARQAGQVAQSPDLSAAIILLAGLLALWFGVGNLAPGLLQNIRLGLSGFHRTEVGKENIQEIAVSQVSRGLELIGVHLGLLFVLGVAAGFLQVGFGFSFGRLAWNWARLSPAEGIQRLFSWASVGRALLLLLKVCVVLLVAYLVLNGRGNQLVALGEGPLSRSAVEAWGLIARLAVAIAGALAVIGAMDYLFRRIALERSLRMSRPELKEEIKREEGDPAQKARIRKLQRESLKQRMLKDVPRASVVITNPTHLAIALRYDRGSMPAPLVVAKGNGAMAKRIVDIARRHAVSVVERKPLAQALFRSVQVGQEIPNMLFQAVAEVLAFVYRLRGGMTGAV